MALYVQKFGGTSVGTAERIKNVARRVVETAAAGHKVCVVVSAMGKTTDELIDLAHELSPDPSRRGSAGVTVPTCAGPGARSQLGRAPVVSFRPFQ